MKRPTEKPKKLVVKKQRLRPLDEAGLDQVKGGFNEVPSGACASARCN